MAEEDRKERVDRELIELLNEVRVVLPGVQVLFAFLLVLPFQEGFAQIGEIARDVYFVGLASSAMASAFLIAPASYHRLNLRRGVDEKERMLLTSSRLTIIGSAFLVAGISCSLFVIADILFGELIATIVAAATAFVICLLWYALPLLARTDRDGAEP